MLEGEVAVAVPLPHLNQTSIIHPCTASHRNVPARRQNLLQLLLGLGRELVLNTASSQCMHSEHVTHLEDVQDKIAERLQLLLVRRLQALKLVCLRK